MKMPEIIFFGVMIFIMFEYNENKINEVKDQNRKTVKEFCGLNPSLGIELSDDIN